MSINKLNYQGDSKILKNLVNAVNALIDAGGGNIALTDLTDTDISSPEDGQALVYDDTDGKWKNSAVPSGGDSVSWTQTQQSGTRIAEIEINGIPQNVYVPTPVTDVQVDGTSVVSQGVANITTPDIDDLDSVNITNPSDGQVLSYDAQNDEWKNTTGGGGTTVIANPQGTPTATLNTVQIGNVIYELPTGGGGVSFVQVSSARPQDNSVSTTVTITQV